MDNLSKWHVDHIIPLSFFHKYFDISDLLVQKIAFHYSNLQPLFPKDNISKNDRIYIDHPDLKNVRKMETTDALKFLGKPHFFDFPDGDLYFVREAAKSIKKFITSIKPDLIVTHAPEDYHPDHRALSEYVNAAAGFTCPILYADCLMGINFIPEYYIDITQYFKQK